MIRPPLAIALLVSAACTGEVNPRAGADPDTIYVLGRPAILGDDKDADAPDSVRPEPPPPDRRAAPERPIVERRDGAPALPGPAVGDGIQVPRTFTPRSGEGAIGYLLYLPPGYETAVRPWPLLLYLHGRSLRGSDLALVKRYGIPRHLDEGRDLPFVVISPQISADRRWVDMLPIGELVDDVIARFRIDPERVYLTGYSMGGDGAWRMAEARPDLFAAVAPLAAHTPAPRTKMVERLAPIPIRAFHGTADELVPEGAAEEMILALRSAGADAELVLLPGADHGDVLRVYRDDELFAWLLTHRRPRRATAPGGR